jgi:hypothetical protein
MSPNTQVALIALILFFAVAGISLVWPRLAGLERSRTRLASGGIGDTINAPEWALPKALAKLRDRPLPPEIQTRALYLGVAVVFISVILTAVQMYYATPPQLVQRISQ